MSVRTALPPWLLAAVHSAGDATVILKSGDRPFVIKSNGPYHLGTQPLTNLMIEGLAQQILSEPGHLALSRGSSVEETMAGPIPVSVNAIRMDHHVVIRSGPQCGELDARVLAHLREEKPVVHRAGERDAGAHAASRQPNSLVIST